MPILECADNIGTLGSGSVHFQWVNILSLHFSSMLSCVIIMILVAALLYDCTVCGTSVVQSGWSLGVH